MIEHAAARIDESVSPLAGKRRPPHPRKYRGGVLPRADHNLPLGSQEASKTTTAVKTILALLFLYYMQLSSIFLSILAKQVSLDRLSSRSFEPRPYAIEVINSDIKAIKELFEGKLRKSFEKHFRAELDRTLAYGPAALLAQVR